MKFIVFCLFVINVFSQSCTRHPIVMVPGIMASMLNASINIPDDVDIIDRLTDCDRQKDWFTLWLNLLDGIPYINKCYLSYMTCHYNTETQLMENLEGVQIEPPQFGYTYACDTISPSFPLKRFSRCFHDIINALEKIGYVDGYDMMGAPYDWRYYHQEAYFENVKKLITQAYDNTGNKVVLMSHSMGGMITYMMLDYFGQEFCDKYIYRWIAMSSPFIGTSMVNSVILGGYNMGYPVSTELIKMVARSFESLVMMAPVKGYWDENEVLVEMADGTQYTVNDLKTVYEMLDEMKGGWVENALTKSFAPYLDKWNSKVPYGVEMHCGITSGLETPGKLTFSGNDFDSDYTTEYVDGDEQVTLNSLEYCQKMTDNFTNLGKYDHQGMLYESVTIDYVINLTCD